LSSSSSVAATSRLRPAISPALSGWHTKSSEVENARPTQGIRSECLSRQ
jgi:hypothetical protein